MNVKELNNHGNYSDRHLCVTDQHANALQAGMASKENLSSDSNRKNGQKQIRHILGLIILVLLVGSFARSVSAETANFHEAQFKKVNLINVTTTADVLIPNDGLCSLREAIISANTNPIGLTLAGECALGSATITDRIMLVSGSTYQLVNFKNLLPDDATANDLDIVDNKAAIDLQIMPDGEDKAVIRGLGPGFDIPVGSEGGSWDRIFDIENATVQVYRLEIRNGVAAHHKDGGGIRNQGGHVTIVDSLLTENRSARGGAIFNLGGTVSLLRSDVIANGNHFSTSADDLEIYGGGIYNSLNAELILEEATISWNRIDYDIAFTSVGRTGSAIFNRGVITFVPSAVKTDIFNNQTFTGGALHNEGGVVQGSSFYIIHNSSTSEDEYDLASALANVNLDNGNIGQVNLSDGIIGHQPAGIGLLNRGSANFTDVTFSFNSKSGIMNKGGDITLSHGNIHVNAGGGLISEAGTVVIASTEINHNEHVGQKGGGIRLMNGADVTITRSSITHNSALAAGGIFIFDSSLMMANSTVSGNETTMGVGGGIMVQGSAMSETVEFFNVTVHDNSSAAGVGSAFFLLSGTIVPETVNSIWSAPIGETACAGNTGSHPLNSSGYNLASDDTCLSIGHLTDQINTDPQLASLAYFPLTQGHEPLELSPAIDQGDLAVCSAMPVNNEDQRGYARGASCDIGAIELDDSQ